MAPARDKTQIISDLISTLTSLDESLDVESGSSVRDISVDAPAEEFARLYEEIDTISKKQSLSDPAGITIVDIIALADNFGIDQKSGERASGSVWFRTLTDPADDIVINAGIKVSTLADSANNISAVEFRTTETKRIPFAQKSSFFNSTDGVWEVEVSVRAVNKGSSGNVGVDKIIKLVSSVSGINLVTNKLSTTGGTDAEDKFALADRTRNSFASGDLSTREGILRNVEVEAGVVSTSIVMPGDDEMKRAGELGNAVDVYIRGEEVVEVEEVYIFDSSDSDIILAQQPIIEISSIVDQDNNSFVEDVDFELVKDTNTKSGSREGQDKISWITGQEPVDGKALSVKYTYNGLIKTLQDKFSQEPLLITNMDILFKKIVTIEIVISIKVKLKVGQEVTTTLDSLESQVINYINGLGNGVGANQSDVISIIESTTVSGTSAVDKVYLPLEEFRKNSEASGTVGDIEISTFEHLKVETINIHI